MNDKTIVFLCALMGIVSYLIIGRIVINVLDERKSYDDHWRNLKVLVFPIVLVWEAIVAASNHISSVIIRSIDNWDRERDRES